MSAGSIIANVVNNALYRHSTNTSNTHVMYLRAHFLHVFEFFQLMELLSGGATSSAFPAKATLDLFCSGFSTRRGFCEDGRESKDLPPRTKQKEHALSEGDA